MITACYIIVIIKEQTKGKKNQRTVEQTNKQTKNRTIKREWNNEQGN